MKFWPGGFAVLRRMGALWLLSHENWLDRQMAFYGSYESDRVARLMRTITDYRCDVFVDIGANFGLYSVHAALLDPVVRVIAFEPEPRNRDQLHAQLYLNGLSERVEVYPVALSNADHMVPFESGGRNFGGKSRIVTSGGAGEFAVPARRLDGLMSFEGRTVAVKIDVEGHELSVLEGMTGLFGRNQWILQVEAFDENANKIKTFLATHGFRSTGHIDDDYYFTNISEISDCDQVRTKNQHRM